jgi:pimeloyl-ACP methyl ester carboxylesterase
VAEQDGWRKGPRVPSADGVEVATWDLGGSGPPLLLVHATGFHARMWLPLASTLRAWHRCWAIDLRGHGHAGHAPDRSYRNWDRFVDDVLAVVDALDLGDTSTGLAGAGHSLGGGVLLLAEQRRPGTFASVYAYEPIVPPPSWRSHPDGVDLSAVARKRRARFASRQQALANYRSKPPFSRFHPDALDAYVAHGTRDDPGGDVVLCCAPDEEASVYEGARYHRAWEHLPEMSVPVTVARGGEDGPAARLVEGVASRLRAGRVERHEALSHFGPMEDPAGIAAAIVEHCRFPPR